ncbi:MAG: hypothetical protein ACRERU_13810 [Methylococcales bacterium]
MEYDNLQWFWSCNGIPYIDMKTSASRTCSTITPGALWMGVSKRRGGERSPFGVYWVRGIYLVLVRIPFALAISVIAMAASSVTIVFSALLCLGYRIIWYMTREGRLYRHSRKMEKRKEKISKKERIRRVQLSRRRDQQNIGELISIVQAEMDRYKNEIMIDVSVLARIQLRDCRRELDFDTAIEIYQSLSQTQAGSINQRLGRQLGFHQNI